MNFYQPPYMGMPINQGMYQQPVYPQFVYADIPSGYNPMEPSGMHPKSSIENIMRLNLGKEITVYMNFENSQWGSKVFKGILQAIGADHIILKDANSEIRYLLLTVYLCYITFDDKIVYEQSLNPHEMK